MRFNGFQRNDSSLLYVVVSDVHVPYQDQNACDAVGELMKDIRPDGVVINGDFWDLLELSKHARGAVAQLEGTRIQASTDACNVQLDDWMAAAGPQCTHNHFIDGNHEHRLDRWMKTGDNAVWLGDEATDIGKRLRLADRGFVYHKGYPDAYCRLGRLIVTHGRWTNKYAAAKHLDAYGHAIMVGHCHTPQMFYGSALNKQKAGYVNGHLADVDSPAMGYAGKPNSWCQGFALVQVEGNGRTFHVQQIQFANGSFYYGGRRYGRKAGR
jgi:predicted phosphodiesterase